MKAERESWSAAQAVGQPERKAEDATGRREPEVEVRGWQSPRAARRRKSEDGSKARPHSAAAGASRRLKLEGQSPEGRQPGASRRVDRKARPENAAADYNSEIFIRKRQRPQGPWRFRLRGLPDFIPKRLGYTWPRR